MAPLSDPDRAALWAEFMRLNPDPCGALTKAELRAAVDAIDQWADDNATEFNQAIPQPARGVLTTKQKAFLLVFVVRRRHEVTA
jgi:hypothetical protein